MPDFVRFLFYRADPDVAVECLTTTSLPDAVDVIARELLSRHEDSAVLPEKRPHHARVILGSGFVHAEVMVVPKTPGQGVRIERVI